MSFTQRATDDDVIGPVLAFLTTATGVHTLTPDQDYIADGLIDSMLALALVARVEQLFDIQVEVEDLDLDNFRTATRVAGFVQRKRAGRGARHG